VDSELGLKRDLKSGADKRNGITARISPDHESPDKGLRSNRLKPVGHPCKP